MKFEIRRNIYHDMAFCVICKKKAHYTFRPLVDSSNRIEPSMMTFVCKSDIGKYLRTIGRLFELEEDNIHLLGNVMEEINKTLIVLNHKEY